MGRWGPGFVKCNKNESGRDCFVTSFGYWWGLKGDVSTGSKQKQNNDNKSHITLSSQEKKKTFIRNKDNFLVDYISI